MNKESQINTISTKLTPCSVVVYIVHQNTHYVDVPYAPTNPKRLNLGTFEVVTYHISTVYEFGKTIAELGTDKLFVSSLEAERYCNNRNKELLRKIRNTIDNYNFYQYII